MLASKNCYKYLLQRNLPRVIKHIVRHPVKEEIAKLQGSGSGWKEQCMAAPFSSVSVPSSWYYYQNRFGEILGVPASEEASLC